MQSLKKEDKLIVRGENEGSYAIDPTSNATNSNTVLRNWNWIVRGKLLRFASDIFHLDLNILDHLRLWFNIIKDRLGYFITVYLAYRRSYLT